MGPECAEPEASSLSTDVVCRRLSEAREARGDQAILLVGDLSGIQQFIYAVAQPESAEAGIARRLRARSLQLTALSQSVCHHLETE